jgi:hypothetical protein
MQQKFKELEQKLKKMVEDPMTTTQKRNDSPTTSRKRKQSNTSPDYTITNRLKNRKSDMSTLTVKSVEKTTVKQG